MNKRKKQLKLRELDWKKKLNKKELELNRKLKELDKKKLLQLKKRE